MEKQKEEIKIFKPVLVSEDKLELDEDSINYNKNLFDGTDDGFIPMDVDKEVAIQRMSKDLYQYASSGFRELYANEARAARYAKKHHDADPMIVIILDPKKRKLVLEGIDSMGMTTDRFKKVFTVLGHSDNFDGTEVGQFGMGRAAYTCLSDTIILETFARESDEKYAVLGRNGLGYQIINKPKLESYGTRISLTLYEKLNYENLYEMIEGVCRFSQIKTILILESELPGVEKKPGQYEMGPMTIQQRVDSLISEYDRKDVYLTIPIHLEDKLIRLDGNINICSWGGGYDIRGYRTPKCETYLVNVPISADISLPLSHGVLTVKDERKLPPTPDRERLAEKTLEKVNGAVQNLMETKSGLNLKNLQEFYKSRFRLLYEVLADYTYDRRNNLDQLIFETFDEKTQHLVSMLHLTVWSKERKKKSLLELLKTSPSEIFHMEKIDKSKIASLEKHCPGCVVFRPQELDHDTMALFEEFEIVSGERYLEEKNINVTRITNTVTECVEHFSEEGYKGAATIPVLNSSRIPFADVSSKTICANSEFQTIRKIFKKVICTYRVVKQRKDIAKGIPFDDFIKTIESKKYPTNGGLMHVSDIAKKKQIVLMQYPDKNLAGLLDSWLEQFLVVSDVDELFEIAVWLSCKNIEYVFVQNIHHYEKEFDLEGMINKYGLARNVSISKDDYVETWYEKTDDIPKLLTLLDGILTINDDRVLKMFMSATKKNKPREWSEMQNNFKVMQQHLQTSRTISNELKCES